MLLVGDLPYCSSGKASRGQEGTGTHGIDSWQKGRFAASQDVWGVLEGAVPFTTSSGPLTSNGLLQEWPLPGRLSLCLLSFARTKGIKQNKAAAEGLQPISSLFLSSPFPTGIQNAAQLSPDHCGVFESGLVACLCVCVTAAALPPAHPSKVGTLCVASVGVLTWGRNTTSPKYPGASFHPQNHKPGLEVVINDKRTVCSL